MKFLMIFAALFIHYDSSNAISEADTKIVLLLQSVRHGVRSVLRSYPNDINQAFWEKYGTGQLLPAGMKQLQDYGAFTMNRYANFLNSTYSPTRVFVRSTDFDRTLQSAAAFLSGAYKPSSTQQWTSVQGQTAWLPIPIHTNNKSFDNILHLDGPCPRFTQLKAEQRLTQDYLINQVQSNQPFIDMLKNLSGIPNLDTYSIYDLGDKFVIQDALGLPNEQYLIENSKRILDIQVHTYNYDFATFESASLVSGGLLNDVVSNLKSKVSSPASSTQQYYLYMIHDTYIAALHKLFNPENTTFFRPDFASGYVFELRNDSSGNYYVQVLLKNSRMADPIIFTPVSVRGCDLMCPLDKFFDLTKDALVSNFDVACKLPPTIYDKITSYFTSILSWFKSVF